MSAAASMSPATTKVGCCGFGMAQATYFKTFPVVEIQETFYQPPRVETAKRWRDAAPAGFEFTLKAWQLITHEARSPTYRRLRTPLTTKQREQVGALRWTDVVRRAWDTTLEIARCLHAEKVLFQCPPSFEPTRQNQNRLRRFFSTIDRGGLVCIWEPRGKWRAAEIATLCEALDLVHCVDPFQAESATGGLHYYRLHGIGGYRHEYTDDELRRLAQRRVTGAAYFLFNNRTMTRDAARFRALVE
jgi:uncharacterized protein YecE (DUF72 family)